MTMPARGRISIDPRGLNDLGKEGGQISETSSDWDELSEKLLTN